MLFLPRPNDSTNHRLSLQLTSKLQLRSLMRKLKSKFKPQIKFLAPNFNQNIKLFVDTHYTNIFQSQPYPYKHSTWR